MLRQPGTAVFHRCSVEPDEASLPGKIDLSSLSVSKVGLVLGGGGVTGAAYHFGALLALEMATGWNPNSAHVIVGTSSGAFVSAMTRGGALHLDTMLGAGETNSDVADWLRGHVYRRTRPSGLVRWFRHGLLPRLTNPSLAIALGSPGMYSTKGIEDWVEGAVGPLADSWPERPTVIVAYDLETRKRVPFGTEAAPLVPLKTAVAASSAVPFMFQPVALDGRWFVDGGVASGTHADLLLANPEPLDLVIVVAPMAAVEARPGARFYEDMFDQAGRTALAMELDRIRHAWPNTQLLVLRPDERVLEAARPNPMSVEAAVPAFLRTLRSLHDQLGRPGTWELLERHLGSQAAA